MKSEACKQPCQVTQPMPPPRAGSPSVMWDQKESTPHHSHLPGRRSLAGQKTGEAFVATTTGKFDQTGKNFLFSWKDEAEFSSFKGRRSWEEGRRREMALFESCCGQDEPTGSFPPLPAIQYYNSIRKGHSSIQMGSYEITLHSINIHMIHTCTISAASENGINLQTFIQDNGFKRLTTL